MRSTSIGRGPLLYSQAMPNVVREVFPIVAQGELELTLNLTGESVSFFLEPRHGRCFKSRDQRGLPGEDVAANMLRLYRAIGIEPPQSFASLALRTSFGGATVRQTLGAYGTLVLRLDLDRLGPELVIVNGDAKNVAYKIAQEDDDTYAVRIPWTNRAAVAGLLTEYFENGRRNRRPRIHGQYIEARLPRALVLADVLSVHVDPRDADAIEAAERLCAEGQDEPEPEEQPA